MIQTTQQTGAMMSDVRWFPTRRTESTGSVNHEREAVRLVTWLREHDPLSSASAHAQAPPTSLPPRSFHFQLSLPLARTRARSDRSLSLALSSRQLAMPIKYPLYVFAWKDNFRVKLNFTPGPTAVCHKPLHLVYIFTPGGPANRYWFR